MKRALDIQAVMERLAPGVLSRDGFLGTDPRPLKEILDADASTVAALHTTHAELAKKLQTVLAVAVDALGKTAEIGDRLRAVYAEGIGRIACPWGSCGTFRKGEVTLTDASTGHRMVFSELGVHLIAKHGFYQGHASRYRLEPADIHRIFRLRGAE